MTVKLTRQQGSRTTSSSGMVVAPPIELESDGSSTLPRSTMTTTDERSIAHIVHPASKLRDVESGVKQRVKALCGAFVGHRSQNDDDPICRVCFVIYNEGELVGGEGR